MNWHMILYVLAAALLIGYGVYTIRQNPGLFSTENIGKSFFTMGILALGLIGFVAILVILLRSSS